MVLLKQTKPFLKCRIKGNHKNSKTFKMPRNPHKRGHDHDYELKKLTKADTLYRKYNRKEITHFVETLYGSEYISWSKNNNGTFDDFFVEYLHIEPMTVKEVITNPRGLSNSKVCVPMDFVNDTELEKALNDGKNFNGIVM